MRRPPGNGERVTRRGAVLGLGANLLRPRITAAQPHGGRKRVGVLLAALETADTRARSLALRDELRRLGWTDGDNVELRYRWGGGDAALIDFNAAELVSEQPDVIVANTSVVLEAVRARTSTIPIVFLVVGEASAGISNFARPGGNVTGFTDFGPTLYAKWLQILKELAPDTRRVLVVLNPGATAGRNQLASLESLAGPLDLEHTVARVDTAAGLEQPVAEFGGVPGGALFVMPDPFTTTYAAAITALAARHRLPAIYAFRLFADLGGLIAYGPDLVDQYRRAASYVDRILRGAKPDDLPVQTPTKLELVVNLRTARELELEVPLAILERADEVIE